MGSERSVAVAVDARLEPSVIEYLRGLGGGDVSEGIGVAEKFHRDAVEKEK